MRRVFTAYNAEKGGGEMRLKTKRYKVRRGCGGWIIGLLLLLGAGAWLFLRHGGALPVFFSPKPTLSPEESAQECRTLLLPGKTWYALQLGAFEEEEAAKALAASFRARGAAGYIHRQDGFRVLAAAYTSRAEAQAVQTQLGALHGVEAYVSEIGRPEITLRVTGQKAQLTALEDALTVLDQCAEQLYALSAGLDSRDGEADAVRQALLSQRETVQALAGRLETLFGEKAPAAVAPIIQAMRDADAALAAAAACGGETALGAQVKYCQLLCISALADYAGMLTE